MREARNLAFICFVLFVPHRAVAQRTGWMATWAASPQPADGDPDEPLLTIEDQTVRERVRVSIGGSQIRVRLSNEYGATPLLVGSVTVATPNDPASIRPGSVQMVTFGGRNSITIAPGAPVVSDPVEFPVPFGSGGQHKPLFPQTRR
jgi:hypothetical protein